MHVFGNRIQMPTEQIPTNQHPTEQRSGQKPIEQKPIQTKAYTKKKPHTDERSQRHTDNNSSEEHFIHHI